MRLVIALLSALPLFAQQIHVTADLLSPQTTAAMFGRLPKQYNAANVTVCSQSAAQITIPLALAAQQVRPSGVVMLPKDAALSVIAAAQGSSTGAKILRGATVAVSFAAIASGWSTLSSTVKNVLVSTALVGGAATGVLSTAIPSHTYLTFDHEAMPDPLQLGPAGCATGVVIVEIAVSPLRVDSIVNLNLPVVK